MVGTIYIYFRCIKFRIKIFFLRVQHMQTSSDTIVFVMFFLYKPSQNWRRYVFRGRGSPGHSFICLFGPGAL